MQCKAPKGHEYMVVTMFGLSDFTNPAVDYTFVTAPSFEGKIFFDTFEEGPELLIFFFDVVLPFVRKADIKSDDVNPTVI